MLKKYVYWSNEKGWHAELILEILAFNISAADKFFTKKTGTNPQKTPTISCVVSEISDTK